MMKKTTSALAVAALLGTGAASAATFQVNDDTTFSISGDVELEYKDVKDDSGNTVSTFEDGGSEIKFYAEQTSANGLTTMVNLEMSGFDVFDGEKDGSGNSIVSDGDAYIGVAGDFGTLKVGQVSTAFDVVADTTNNFYEGGGFFVRSSGTNENAFQYSSPDLDGVSFVVDTQLAGDGNTNIDGSEETTARVNMSVGTATVMVGYADNSDGDEAAIGVSGPVGPVSASALYQSGDAIKSTTKTDIASLFGSIPLGPVTAYSSVSNVDADGSDSRTEISVGALYGVADNLTVYAEHVDQDQATEALEAGDGLYIGANLKF